MIKRREFRKTLAFGDGGTLSLPSLAGLAIGLAAQNQVAGFFASDGKSIPDPNQTLFGFRFFEVPAALPEDLGC
jgi:hypothetical protein